jgi:hypothetical protein
MLLLTNYEILFLAPLLLHSIIIQIQKHYIMVIIQKDQIRTAQGLFLLE